MNSLSYVLEPFIVSKYNRSDLFDFWEGTGLQFEEDLSSNEYTISLDILEREFLWELLTNDLRSALNLLSQSVKELRPNI